MRYFTVIVSALLFQSLTAATRFKGCSTDPPSGWVSNCNQADNLQFGTCCRIYGYCGFGADFCGPGNCHSGDCDPDDEGGPSTNGE
ncbi:hypothetical protein EsH8_X_000075 [Colletotrichum jinshuiense]